MSIGSWLGDMRQAMGRASQAHAEWELQASRTILTRRRKWLLVALLPILLCLAVQAASAADLLPQKLPVLGGSKAYMPSFATGKMFYGSILVGLIAGLITGVIGAGGGYILTPALMSFGVRGIMAVGTDQFHLFAKAIMGTTLHRKMGNVNIRLAALFVAGSLVGVTIGGRLSRAIFQHSPAMSDAVISTVYVVVLGILGMYAIGDFIRLRRRGADASADATTPFAKRLQALPLKPRVAFDEDIVPGGRRISIYPVMLCGLIVGFVASIMGVGGGFLTFPMFVYGLGVSTFTTVGTDLLQIIFTTSYSSIFQYAIYGFVFYTISIGMLLGSLVGVQIGAMVTKVVKGSRIRVFYALTILAGFTNRLFALPRKLADLGYLSISRPTSMLLETIGNVLFFAIVGGFALWVLAVFAKNVKLIRAGGKIVEAGQGRRLIVDARKFRRGLIGLAAFVVALVFGLLPTDNGANALDRADDFFNRLAKDSAFYIPEARQRAERFDQTAVDLGVAPREHTNAAQLVRLLEANGFAGRLAEDGRVRVEGKLGGLAQAALADAEAFFQNKTDGFDQKYQMTGPETVYGWWNIFNGLERRYNQESRAAEMEYARFVASKALEPAYNFRGIESRRCVDCILPACLLLGSYVLYTLWYGFSILWIFEGLGITTSGWKENRET